ncbi:hypothetical protein AS156_31465 [Bradyrhizobium macuxiense]|uniref:Uncharacterized protein n=1 Tax=Bradyrhizobium macuxiense TaxID=1755647 RepID=A0A109K2N0_9BRAD|nr:hypothetical protein AS156_31465 [Bradyrhizobium macuxiense]
MTGDLVHVRSESCNCSVRALWRDAETLKCSAHCANEARRYSTTDRSVVEHLPAFTGSAKVFNKLCEGFANGGKADTESGKGRQNSVCSEVL